MDIKYAHDTTINYHSPLRGYFVPKDFDRLEIENEPEHEIPHVDADAYDAYLAKIEKERYNPKLEIIYAVQNNVSDDYEIEPTKKVKQNIFNVLTKAQKFIQNQRDRAEYYREKAKATKAQIICEELQRQVQFRRNEWQRS
jgi:ABC-type antimicrobial peptide transport system permease subunit